MIGGLRATLLLLVAFLETVTLQSGVMILLHVLQKKDCMGYGSRTSTDRRARSRKVDGVRSKYLNTAIDAQWKKIGNGGIEHEIFHDFIERERNNILKQYNFNEWRFHRNELDTEQGDKILVGTRILTTKSALSEALKWWEFTLGDIEASAHQYLVGARQSSSTVISPKLPDLVLR
ncbi:hypothetical protein E6W36_06340 [Hankyongella ginsenosidimutans]|uniref:Uncharacterized protein n=1 Tax=Hankyongella ginsenosidimutans TaxID=1763828 RepID=A0A4D7BUS5_9SPHN|nr:hypothetical protein [Hankyongella ginsenosidimutans]QCI79309.1 hypothetical protein E6W36_06340 [Hankyongella ginsenosidimutans]